MLFYRIFIKNILLIQRKQEAARNSENKKHRFSFGYSEPFAMLFVIRKAQFAFQQIG